MCRGGIQDRINPYHDPITVRTDPEDPEEPLMVKDLRYYWSNAQRICWTEKRHVEELRRLLVQCEETCSKLAEYQKWLIDPHSRYTSEAFLHTLIDSYDNILNDASWILHAIKHNDQPHMAVGCIVNALKSLDVAAEKLAFLEDLHNVMERQRRALARILPRREDTILPKFYISLGCDGMV